MKLYQTKVHHLVVTGNYNEALAVSKYSQDTFCKTEDENLNYTRLTFFHNSDVMVYRQTNNYAEGLPALK